MHYHFTESQLFVAGFTLLLGAIFALAAVLELRTKKHPPLRSFFCAGLDRNLFANVAFSEPEIPYAHRRRVFADIDDHYLNPANDQTEALKAVPSSFD